MHDAGVLKLSAYIKSYIKDRKVVRKIVEAEKFHLNLGQDLP